MPHAYIIGSAAAGPAFAGRLRRLREDYDITIVEKSSNVSSATCGIPFALSGEVPAEKLTVMSKQQLSSEFALNVLLNTECVSIDCNNKTLCLKTESNEVVERHYDILFLSVGCSSFVPPLPGANLPNVFSVRTLDDLHRIKPVLSNSKHCTIVGGGFIGLECAESLQHLGMKVTVVELLDQLMGPFDKEYANYIHSACWKNGVNVLLETKCQSIVKNGDYLSVETSNGSVQTDFVLFCVGILPNTKFLQDSQITLTDRGFIKTTDFGQCVNSHDEPLEGVFACGDATLFRHVSTNEKIPILLAGPTARGSRICATNAVNPQQMSPLPTVNGNSIIRVFDQFVGQVGASKKMLVRANVDFKEVHGTWVDHPEWFGSFAPIHVTVRFDKHTDRILGASVGGLSRDVPKILDSLSVFIQMKATSADLSEFELAYAPPVAGPKSVINFIGNAVQNELEGIAKFVTPDEVVDQNIPLVDVRPPPMRKMMGHVRGSVNIPLAQLRESNDLPTGRFAVICKGGKFSHTAYRLLVQRGFDVANVSGGFFAFARMFPQLITKE
ncbi:hypothetical protein P9112_013931 [Eukaryota sp. TZLM1-RC]